MTDLDLIATRQYALDRVRETDNKNENLDDQIVKAKKIMQFLTQDITLSESKVGE